MINVPNFKYKPLKFFSLSLIITWIAWFIAAYFSFNESLENYKYFFVLLGLAGPFVSAMFLIYGSGNDGLKMDFRKRLTDLKLVKPVYLPVIVLIMPAAVVLAITISLLFGETAHQFSLSPGFSVAGAGAVMLVISIIIAPAFEELGWRGYGVDSLSKNGRSRFGTTLIFVLFWALWHLPLFLINGYYHYEMLHANILYALNFVVSVLAAGFLSNWIYYKNNRSIPANILFHVMLNLSFSSLQMAEFTKCIVTIILILACVILFFKYKNWWLERTA
jgi:uncharacterized protein